MEDYDRMGDMQQPAEEGPRPLPRWEDLEAFLVLAAGVEAGRTIQEIGEEGSHGYGGPRLLYLRLARLEDAFGVRLIERRKWSRNAHLTEDGRWLAAELRRLRSSRATLQTHFTDRRAPVLAVSATSTIISTLLPAIVRAMKRDARLTDLRLSLLDREREEDVLQDVHENRAAVGLAVLHGHRLARSDVRVETLLESPRVLVCHESHPFATRARHDPSRADVDRREISHERLFVRPPDVPHVPPPSHVGEHFLVPRLDDARAYVRVGLGVTISLAVLETLFGPDEHLRVLPLRPTARLPIGLLLPRKQERVLVGPTASFLETVRVVCQELARPGARNHAGVQELPSPLYRRVAVPAPTAAPPAAGPRAGVPFDPRRDLTGRDWRSLADALQAFARSQYWEDYLSLACYLHRLDPRRAAASVRPSAEAWTGMEAILHHWQARENWHEFAWYAFALRLLCRACGRPDIPIGAREWEGMVRVLDELRGQHQWYHFVRHASRLVRADPSRPITVSASEWARVLETLERFRREEQWFDFAWLARTLSILDPERARATLRLHPADWAGMRSALQAIRESANGDHRKWFTFALHAYSMARIAERSRDIPVRRPVAASMHMGNIRAAEPARMHERR